MKHIILFENYSENKELTAEEVINFMKTQMEKDKKEYNGSKWDDFSWIVTEIMQFLQKEYATSYLLQHFKDYDYSVLNNILKKHFKIEYEHAVVNLNENFTETIEKQGILAFEDEIKFKLKKYLKNSIHSKTNSLDERIEQLMNIHKKYIEMHKNILSADEIAEKLYIYDKNLNN